MSTSRPASLAAANARNEILTQLKDDHKRVKKAYRDFQKFDSHNDPNACQAIVQQVLDALTVHAALEEELLYPAARDVIEDKGLIDEAEIEHESIHTLIDQLRSMSPDDDKYTARFTVLCEYVLHHVKEEEREMFPQLERVGLEWESIAAEMKERREELTPTAQDEDDEAGDTATFDHRSAPPRRAPSSPSAQRRGSSGGA